MEMEKCFACETPKRAEELIEDACLGEDGVSHLLCGDCREGLIILTLGTTEPEKDLEDYGIMRASSVRKTAKDYDPNVFATGPFHEEGISREGN